MTLLNADPVETKQLLDKLVVIKLNGALGTKMGFSGHFDGLSKKNGALVVLLMFSRHQMPMFLLFYFYLCNCRSATEVCNGLSGLDY